MSRMSATEALLSNASGFNRATAQRNDEQPTTPGKPDCPDCHGLGYVRFEVGINHPLFGRIFYCECVPHEKRRD